MLGRRVIKFPEERQCYIFLPIWVVNISDHRSCVLMIHYLLFLDLSCGISAWITSTTWSRKPSISQSTYFRGFFCLFFFLIIANYWHSPLLFLVVWQFYSIILVFLSLMSLLAMQTSKDYWKHRLFIARSFLNLSFVTVTGFSNSKKLQASQGILFICLFRWCQYHYTGLAWYYEVWV